MLTVLLLLGDELDFPELSKIRVHYEAAIRVLARPDESELGSRIAHNSANNIRSCFFSFSF